MGNPDRSEFKKKRANWSMSQFNSNMCRLCKWANHRIFDLLLTICKSAKRTVSNSKLKIVNPPYAWRINRKWAILDPGSWILDTRRASSIEHRESRIENRASSTLNCRVQLTKQKTDNSIADAFTIELGGSIRAASESDYATVQILITDATEGTDRAKPVHSQSKQWQMQDAPPVFCYRADLGKLPHKVTTLSDWMTVAHLNIDWLLFPHKGKRALQFSTSVLSSQSGQELAHAECLFAYENPAFGYVDLHENICRAKSLAVALAFAVSAADNKMYHSEVQLIKNWAKANICSDRPPPVRKAWPGRCLPGGSLFSHGAGDKLDRAMEHAVCFFQKGNQLDIHKVCKEVVEIAPVCDRYDILDLCLQVARAKGTVAAEELVVLKYIATWLEVDMDRFRAMMEKRLPVNIHQVKDAKVVLGLSCDMGKERTRRQLNKQYRQWNSRVTNADPEIQAQADQMLKLIAEARSQYVG
jgi:hypothetical protein